MGAMTYTSLQSDIRAYLERGYSADSTVFAQLPSLINLAERSIATDLKLQGFLASITSTMSVGQSIYAKPDRWRRTVSISYGAGTALNQNTQIYPRSYEYCRTYWPTRTLTGAPKFYADYDFNHWLIVPTPVAAYPFEVMCYRLPALLSDTTGSNWVTDYAPNALLYGALHETCLFLKDMENAQVWKGKYAEAMSSLSSDDLKKIVDRTSTRQEA